MKTDMQLQRDVIDELNWHPATGESAVRVAAKDGMITLSGAVTSYAKKLSVARAAEGVSGVRAVADEIAVALPDGSVRTDTDIAYSAVQVLQWHVEVPDSRIEVRVDRGWITLNGNVDWQFQRNEAEYTVGYLAGVKGLFNHIAVEQPIAVAADVRARIGAALHRSAVVDSARVAVDAHDGTVTLRGTLRSWAERQGAENAAWAAPGVSKVEDLIIVAATAPCTLRRSPARRP
jgi:osmotically-inducible protein OsmY